MSGKRGRPTKFKHKYHKIITDLMAKGYSKSSVAGALSINRKTLYSWCQTNNELSNTIKIGELRSFRFWEKIGMLGLMGKLDNFNSSVWIFIMKTRFHKILRQDKELSEGFN